MTPVDQAHYRLDDPLGDCLAACVASVLDLPLEAVPDVMAPLLDGTAPEGYRYTAAMNEWLISTGLWLKHRFYGRVRSRFYGRPLTWHSGYWIAATRSKAVPGGGLHSVVMFGDEVVHDPQPLARQEPYASRPYRFAGELWFEAWDPALAASGLRPGSPEEPA